MFIYLFLAVLGLHCCTWSFSSCGEQELLFVAVCGFLITVASLIVEHGLQARGLQQLQHVGSVVVAHGLQSTGSVVVAHGLSCYVACGIFPDQGSNPCPLHWQADSQSLCHQGSPLKHFQLLKYGMNATTKKFPIDSVQSDYYNVFNHLLTSLFNFLTIMYHLIYEQLGFQYQRCTSRHTTHPHSHCQKAM